MSDLERRITTILAAAQIEASSVLAGLAAANACRHRDRLGGRWVLTKVENAVTVEVGEFTLKGVRRPLAGYNVVAAVPLNP